LVVYNNNTARITMKIQPRTPLFYVTSFTILGLTFYGLDRYLSGSYYQYLNHHKVRRIEEQEAKDDLARDRIRKRQELEKQQQQQQQQQK
ncbi:hypothetical protein SAMD00019534_091130, partial [Acytostelium subglobosum LB1]|uniref:hypothetical protein n=1 Tax=Acytostelium subglobosum LB1 TaxID=1410327 RepID=UPI0006450134